MAKVKILIEGYAKKVEKGWIASSTACLVTAEDKKIITDPGRGNLVKNEIASSPANIFELVTGSSQ